MAATYADLETGRPQWLTEIRGADTLDASALRDALSVCVGREIVRVQLGKGADDARALEADLVAEALACEAALARDASAADAAITAALEGKDPEPLAVAKEWQLLYWMLLGVTALALAQKDRKRAEVALARAARASAVVSIHVPSVWWTLTDLSNDRVENATPSLAPYSTS